ncbi:MAG TPA: 50S ribosomal protein L10 [Candidatus Sulfotelmatobacter sp.]|nr:50S ribosomal protein L10 [Candidatus Sulfotelmatobacter sp.]
MSEKAIALKQQEVNELKEKIGRAKVLVVSDYLGYSVKQITDLRKKLFANGSEFRVVKNTLIERAVADCGYDALKDHLKGASALLLGFNDAVAPLKVLVKFIKDNEKGEIRVGVVEKTVFNATELGAIAKLPAKEVLIAKAIGGLQAPLSGLVNVLQGPIRKLVYALDAIKKQKGGE